VRGQRTVLALGALGLVLWLGLVTTFSQSSFAALLAGMAALAALRWSLRWTLAACLGAVLAAVVFVLAAGGSLKIDLSTEQQLNKDTGGRANLVSEGVDLFANRPVWGYGSGSFSVAYQAQRSGGSGQLTESHTEPVTVAAEQGLIGLVAYVALIAAAFAGLAARMRGTMPGLRGPPPAQSRRLVEDAARAAVLGCFTGLFVHTLAYAGFLEDPLTWLLLAVGGSLAATRAKADV
jgi:O-antigen ligase